MSGFYTKKEQLAGILYCIPRVYVNGRPACFRPACVSSTLTIRSNKRETCMSGKTKPYKERQAYQQAYQKIWIKNRRSDWIKRNGPCKICGTWDKLEVDHIDPKLKTMHASSVWSRTESVRIKELKNCQVLCKAHHLAKTLAERLKPICSSTISTMYDKHNCRCDLCKEAKRRKSMRSRNPLQYKKLYGS